MTFSAFYVSLGSLSFQTYRSAPKIAGFSTPQGPITRKTARAVALPSAVLSRSQAVDQPLRIAIVGALGKGWAHARALQSLRGATLSAVVDRAPEANQVAVELDVPFYNS